MVEQDVDIGLTGCRRWFQEARVLTTGSVDLGSRMSLRKATRSCIQMRQQVGETLFNTCCRALCWNNVTKERQPQTGASRSLECRSSHW